MNDLSSVELVLLQARTGLSPSDAQLRQLESRIVGVSLAGAVPPAQAPISGRWAAFQATGGAGVLAAALLVTGGFLAGYFARALPAQNADMAQPLASNVSSTPAAAAEAAATAPAPTEPAASATSATALEPAAHPGGARPEGRAGALRPRAARSSLGASTELVLLERIDRALRNADAPLALALLDELERRHPHTRLDEERRAARLLADCVAGSGGAGVAARNFLAARPASVYASRLRAVCEVE